ncbi:MAG TPA: hypothetical protein PLD54_03550 [Candidatus Levybacteria bacterium]|nr:hypothetical protein [Candidatus Levybacteria bacterium]
MGNGPAYEPAINVPSEEYVQAPGGNRAVQYFDKSRMEYNGYRADGQWAVTNGLLIVELVTGRMQVGDNEFVTCDASDVYVAGDPGQTDPWSYADFTNEFSPGSYEWDPIFKSFGIYQTGLASTLLKELEVPVNGKMTTVFVQLGQRQSLTYTPSNPSAHQIEFGNVGQHYYQWRYGANGCTDTQPEPDRPSEPTTDGIGIPLANTCEVFQLIAGNEVCFVIPERFSVPIGTITMNGSNGFTYTHRSNPLGESSLAIVIRTHRDGAGALQIRTNRYGQVLFYEDLDSRIICQEYHDCRAGSDGMIGLALAKERTTAIFVGSVGGAGYQVTYNFTSVENLVGTVINTTPYSWN